MFKQLNSIPILILGFAATVIIGVTISVFGIMQMRELVADSEQIVNDHNRRASLANQMHIIALQRPLLLYAMANTQDPFARDELFLKFRALGEQFFRARNELLEMPISAEENRLLEAQNEQTQHAGSLQYQVIDLLSADRFEEARTLLTEAAIPAQQEAFDRINELIRYQYNSNQLSLNESRERLANTQLLIEVWGIGFLLIAAAIGYYVVRKVKESVSLVSHSRDELARLNQEIHESEKMERAIRENVLEGIITIGIDGRIQSFNKAAESMFGLKAHDVLNRPIEILIPEPIRSQHQQYISNYLETGKTHIIGHRRELQALHKNGHLFPITLGVTEIFQKNQRIFVGVIRDITEQHNAKQALEQAHDELEERVHLRTTELRYANAALEEEIAKRKHTQQQLEHLATHDTLTALPNRALFIEHLERTLAQATRRNQQVALLFIDLDGFKEVNDTQGHDVGDQLLVHVAERLSERIRAEDLLARVGGDEFTLIVGPLPQARHHAVIIAQSLIDTLNSPFNIDNHLLNIGASIGIAVFPDDSSDAETLIRHADDAMYAIKKTGKNHYLLYDSESTD